MADEQTPVTGPDAIGDEYEETVVEYVDNRRGRTVLAVVLVILFFLLIGVGWFVLQLATPTGAPDSDELPEGVTWIRSIYAWGETVDEQLVAPVDAAVAPDGTIWVTTNKTKVVAFRPDGRPLRIIEGDLGTGPGQVVAFEGLDVDEEGNVYVADFGKNAVLVFSEEGELLQEWGVQQPNEIAVRGDRVAVAAAYGVGLFDTEGNLIAQWGKRGSEDADFDLPHGIEIGEDGTVYVSDTQNRRVKAYDQNGRLLWIKQAPFPEDLESTTATETVDDVRQNLQIPSSMVFDGAGRLLLVDPFEFQIVTLDTEDEGTISGRWGEFGPEDGKFAYPTGLGYDPTRDTFAVADTANNRVQIIRLPGSGGNLLTRGIAAATDRPYWICLLPLILLLLALIVAAMRRRRQKREEAARDELPAAMGDVPVTGGENP
jgi:sugar lactone lactonase YvrE